MSRGRGQFRALTRHELNLQDLTTDLDGIIDVDGFDPGMYVLPDTDVDTGGYQWILAWIPPFTPEFNHSFQLLIMMMLIFHQ